MIWPEKLAFALAVGGVLTPLCGYFAALLYPEVWVFLFLNLFAITALLTEGSDKALQASTTIALPLLLPAVLSSKIGWPTTIVALPLLALTLRNRPILLYLASPLVGATAALATVYLWPTSSGDSTFSLFLSNGRENIRFIVTVALTGFFVGAVFGRAMYENTR